MTLRQRTQLFMELARPEDRVSYWFDIFMIVLILANVLAIVLDTVESIHAVMGDFFDWFELISVIIFTVEYILRVWSCVDEPGGGYRGAVTGRLKYMLTPMALIDLIAFLPFYLGTFFGVDLRFLRIFRLFRLLKLTRYSPALTIIWAVMVSQRRALTAAFLVMLTALLFSSTILFELEHQVQPDKFSSIPASMWWAIATLTTVGYGDVTPITDWGRFFGAITMILGIIMFALPTGVIATGFATEIRKRDFVVNWKLVSSVPLFKDLDAAQIAEIVYALTPLVVPANYAVVKVGEEADSMFFIVSGKMEVELPPEPFVVSEGEFFGEISILENRKRVATIVSLTECQLLELKAEDFKKLLTDHASIRDALDQVLETRRKHYSQLPSREQV